MPWPRDRQDRGWTTLVVGLAVSLGWAALGSAGQAAERRTPVVEAVQRVQPSVVSISSEKKANSTHRWPFSAEESRGPRVSGMGTGVILDGRGYILTNHHVVDRVEGIEVHLADGGAYPARVVSHDGVMDLAILKIDAGRPLAAITLGTSADLMVGETVIAIGNAFGYENTVSVGIISALKRNVTLSDDQVYRDLIQTDACINPGNSGGPLVNVHGELIGINVAVRAGAQGIGFALPIDDVKRVAADMLSTRRLAATWHGLVAGETQQSQGRQVVVTSVMAGSPAEAAGLRQGDHVVKVGDLTVATPLDIERGLLDARPGQPTEVVIRRGGRDQTVPLEVQPLPRALPNAADLVWRHLGLKVVPVQSEAVRAFSSKVRGGLYVEAVAPQSPAAQAQIHQGDVLLGMFDGELDRETIQPDDILFILEQPGVAHSRLLKFYAIRHNTVQQGVMRLSEGMVIKR